MRPKLRTYAAIHHLHFVGRDATQLDNSLLRKLRDGKDAPRATGQPRHEELIPGGERSRKAVGLIEKRTVVDRHYLSPDGERAGGRGRPEEPTIDPPRQGELLPQMTANPFRCARWRNHIKSLGQPGDDLTG